MPLLLGMDSEVGHDAVCSTLETAAEKKKEMNPNTKRKT